MVYRVPRNPKRARLSPPTTKLPPIREQRYPSPQFASKTPKASMAKASVRQN
jgi:hypothetical protein